MKQKDLFENFFDFRFWRNDVSFFDTITSKLGYSDVRAIWIMSGGSNRFLCFVFMVIKVGNPCSLSLLSPHYPQEFHFYPPLGVIYPGSPTPAVVRNKCLYTRALVSIIYQGFAYYLSSFIKITVLRI
jgi:hypothetical protein